MQTKKYTSAADFSAEISFSSFKPFGKKQKMFERVVIFLLNKLDIYCFKDKYFL